MKKVTLDCDIDGNLILPLDEDIMSAAGFEVGDTLEWIDNGDGSWTMKKKEEMEWVLVETVQSFRMRYMVQVPKGKSEYALDTVTCNEAKEFSQHYIGENIFASFVMTEEEALEMCDQDNEYGKKWSKESKIKSFFTLNGEKIEQ